MLMEERVVSYAVFEESDRDRVHALVRDFEARSHRVEIYDDGIEALELAMRSARLRRSVITGAAWGAGGSVIATLGAMAFGVEIGSQLAMWAIAGGLVGLGLLFGFAHGTVNSLQDLQKLDEAAKEDGRFAMVVQARRSRLPFILSRMSAAGARVKGAL